MNTTNAESPILFRLVTENIRFHWYGEQDWGTGRQVLSFLDRVLTPSMRTVETGAGKSTILFGAKGCTHYTITPSLEEIERIRAYAQVASVSLERVKFFPSPSEVVLPTLHRHGEFDLALIDGSHAFPWPFIDFFYLSRVLRRYGLLIVDDLGIWSCRQLADYLLRSPEWLLVQKLPAARALVFQKSVAAFTDEWMRQPFGYQVPLRQRIRRVVGKLIRGIAPGGFRPVKA